MQKIPFTPTDVEIILMLLSPRELRRTPLLGSRVNKALAKTPRFLGWHHGAHFCEGYEGGPTCVRDPCPSP